MATVAPSRLDRALRVFADVRAGEGVTVVLLALNLLLILQSYYILKPIREALILSEGSPALKSYMSVAQVGLLMIAVPVYGRLAMTRPRIKLIRLVTLFFVVCLLAFYAVLRAGIQVGLVYFLWIGIFNLMIVSQFWAFANDLYTKDEGERLFPIVGFGGSLGAVVGSLLAGNLITSVGVYQTLLIGAIALSLQMCITWYVDRRERERISGRETASVQPAEKGVSTGNAFALVVRSPYLLTIGFMLLVLYQIDAIGEFILASVVKERATAMVAAGVADGLTVSGLIGRFYSRYYALINTGSLLIQLFIVSRLVKRWGVNRAVTVSPSLAMVAFATIALVPNLMFVLVAMVVSKSTDYSLNNTVRNMLFLPCTREEKYSAKQAIDSIFVRMGDVSSAALVFLGTSVLAWTTTEFASVTFLSASLALVLAIVVGRYYKQFSTTGSMGVTSTPRAPNPITPQLRRQNS